MKSRDKSPCIDVCRYTGPKGWCVACGLTAKEARGWKKLKPYGRKGLLKQLSRRKAELEARGLSP